MQKYKFKFGAVKNLYNMFSKIVFHHKISPAALYSVHCTVQFIVYTAIETWKNAFILAKLCFGEKNILCCSKIRKNAFNLVLFMMKKYYMEFIICKLQEPSLFRAGRAWERSTSNEKTIAAIALWPSTWIILFQGQYFEFYSDQEPPRVLNRNLADSDSRKYNFFYELSSHNL